MSHATTIVRVVAVHDTRDYVEDGDRFVPVAGSGQAHDCDRCGRSHEVHATVELSDGTMATVGTSCAKGESLAVQSALSRGAARAKRAAGLQREAAALEAHIARYDRLNRAIDRLPRTVRLYSDLHQQFARSEPRKRLLADVGEGKRKAVIVVAWDVDRAECKLTAATRAEEKWREGMEGDLARKLSMHSRWALNYKLKFVKERLARALLAPEDLR